MELWNKYLEYHPEFLTRLDLLEKRSKDRFIKRLKNEKDRNNFLAVIAELNFYEIFKEKGFAVEYDKEYVLTKDFLKCNPDLTIIKNGKTIIAEVVYLNTTNKDSIRNEFENYLLEELQKIQIGCCIHIGFKEEYFDVEAYEKEDIIKQFADWIPNNCVLGNELVVLDNFVFTVSSVNESYEHILVMGNANSIDIDTRRLNSENSRFINKIGKYNHLINELNLPYIICVKIDFHAAINEKEMFWTLYGDLVFFEDLQIYHSELNGVYYLNEYASNLSGVLLLVNNKVHYFHNYRQQRLGEYAITQLQDLQYHCETFNILKYLQRVVHS